jgi:hypothetical protein
VWRWPLSVSIIRTSERRTKKRCEWRWYQEWVEGWTPKGRPALPLWFGTGVHEALAQWYQPGTKRGVHPADAFLDWVKNEQAFIRVNNMGTLEADEDEFVDARLLGEKMLEGYVDKYGEDESWDIIATETSFQVDIPYPGDKALLAIYAGTFDGVYRDLMDDKIWLLEHKTAKAINTLFLPLDEQAGSYWALASKILQSRGVLRKGDTIKGIMYNFLRKAMPDERPQNAEGKYLNKNGSVSKQQPAPLFLREEVGRDRRERAMQLRRIQIEALDMEAAKQAEPDRLKKTPTRDCPWDCALWEMCLLHEKGTDSWKEFREAMFVQRDPYADHRKSAE